LLVELPGLFTILSIVKILFFPRKTTQFLTSKHPRKNPSNPVLT
jgi:hypothetical protein